MPGARVRSYRFAEILRSRGVDAGVLSMADDFGARDGEDLFLMGNMRRLHLIHRAMESLKIHKNLTIVSQRAKYPALAAYFMFREEGTPYVFDYDDWELDLENFFYINRVPLLSRLSSVKAFTERFARGASRCIAASRKLEKLLSEWNPKVYYLPTGVDTDLYCPKDDCASSDVTSFVWSGLVWGELIYRSILDVAEGLERARRRGAKIRLVLVGDGVWMPVLQSALSRLYPALDARFEGWVEPDRMPDLLARMSVGIMTLAADPRRADWMESKSPTKMFEYMAMGMPVLASRIGEPCHILEQGREGFLFDSPEDVEDASLRLAKDPELRRLMGRAAREKVMNRYSLKSLGDLLMEAVVGK